GNSTVALTRLNVFLCPSAPVPSYNGTGLAVGTPYINFPVTGNCYFASMGSSLEFDASQTGGPPNGRFHPSGTSTAPRGNIPAASDGVSNTIAFGEWKPGTGTQNVVTIPQDVIFAGLDTLVRGTSDMIMSPANNTRIQAWFTKCAQSASNAAMRGPRTV